MKTEYTNLLLLTISAFWSSSRWPRPPRWAPEGREVSNYVVVIDRFHCIYHSLPRYKHMKCYSKKMFYSKVVCSMQNRLIPHVVTYISLQTDTWASFYQDAFILTPAWINNCIHYEVWGGIIYPLPNWSLGMDFIPHFTGDVISYPCRD